jgi:hypothetical protein
MSNRVCTAGAFPSRDMSKVLNPGGSTPSESLSPTALAISWVWGQLTHHSPTTHPPGTHQAPTDAAHLTWAGGSTRMGEEGVLWYLGACTICGVGGDNTRGQGKTWKLESANWRETHGKRVSPPLLAAPAVAPAKASHIFSLTIHATVSWLHGNMPLLD